MELERVALHERWRDANLRLIDRSMAEGVSQRAADLAETLITRDTLDEPATCALMAAAAAAADVGRAAYRALASALDTETPLAPSEATSELALHLGERAEAPPRIELATATRGAGATADRRRPPRAQDAARARWTRAAPRGARPRHGAPRCVPAARRRREGLELAEQHGLAVATRLQEDTEAQPLFERVHEVLNQL